MSTTCLHTWLPGRVAACPWTLYLIFFVGAFTVARFLLKTSFVLAQTFVLHGKNLDKFGTPKGSWAVVTGASGGIGKEFALQLAAAGFNILLVARNEVALTAVAAEIGSNTAGKVEARIQLMDFAKNDPTALTELESTVSGLDVGILVNNAGKWHTLPSYFAETAEQEIEDIVTVNIMGTLRVTHAILPGMIQRKRGLILNVGSFAGEVPSPMISTYSGTKAFLSTFTSALADEIRPHHIMVQYLNTYFVFQVTKMTRFQKSSMLAATPAAYVHSVLSKIGLSCGAALSDRPDTLTPYWSHALFDYVIYVVGRKAFFTSYFHRTLTDYRRALQKSDQEAKQQ
ncbi:hypothetical protein JVT61DRAFT_9185 [Boletus reticuloceps]|uniref:Very-long-chain 3-oxoacyl-CoA reductase n=1 Tax=Boletus reticuloceps TaxID=495285 RepID=A0A8I2YCA3_9AGAM|nr:hypothetical protein JVT61DRAFT_15034 [Boletus reticuloceps]KAG6371823.1 hypothetical protein JVT61DRAFT_9185 [Boletus reticuloceps]